MTKKERNRERERRNKLERTHEENEKKKQYNTTSLFFLPHCTKCIYPIDSKWEYTSMSI